MKANVTRKALVSFFLFMLFAAFFGAIANASGGIFTDSYGNRWTYTLNGTQVQIDAVSLYSNSVIIDPLVVPSQIEGLPVTSVKSLLNGKINVRSVTIPSGVVTIGNNCFYNYSGLANVSLPPSLKSIGTYAFSKCTNLNNVVIPPGVAIGDNAFRHCTALKSLTISAASPGITQIGAESFSECSDLTYINIPGNVKNIGEGAFMSCPNLASVTLSEGVTSIALAAFADCPKLSVVNLPASVSTIAPEAFYGCDKLMSVTVAASSNPYFISVGGALYNADKTRLIFCLPSSCGVFNIPSSVKTISESAFEGCSRLTGIIIPSGVTTISNRAFAECTNLTTMTIPNTVTSLGTDAFSGCSGLTSVTVPGSITVLSSSTFAGCTGLVNVTLGNGITSINAAFYSCTALTGIILPATVTSIGDSAFYGCSALKNVRFRGAMPAFGSNVFVGTASQCKAYYPYSQASWSAYTGPKQAFCIVTVNPQGGVATTQAFIDRNAAFAKPTDPVRTGYVFGGWYPTAVCNTTALAFPITVTQDLTIYAKWTPIPYDVVFYSPGASPAATGIVVPYGSLISAPASPVRAGYTFAGWYKESACTHAWNFSTDRVAGTTVLSAKWAIAAPTSPKAASASYNSILVSWSAVPGVSGYEVFRDMSSTGTFATKAGETTTTLSLTNSGLVTGTKYYYKIKAYRIVNSSRVYGNWSSVVFATPVPAVPGSVVAARKTLTSVQVTWGAVAGANGYEVQRATSSTGANAVIFPVTTGTTFLSTGLTTGTTYYYKVRAYRTMSGIKVYGDWSAAVSAKP